LPYETVEDADGEFTALTPMSKLQRKNGNQQGAKYLEEKPKGSRRFFTWWRSFRQASFNS
jgi:alanine dehydrogenase